MLRPPIHRNDKQQATLHTGENNPPSPHTHSPPPRQPGEKSAECSHEREEGKFPDSQSFHTHESLKPTDITSASIFTIIIPSYALYRIIRISVIFCSTRACSKCAMIRPLKHDLAVLASTTPILSLLVFIIAIFSGIEVHMQRYLSKVNGRKIMVASPSVPLRPFL